MPKRPKRPARPEFNEAEIRRRALAAYFRFSEGDVEQPSADGVRIVEHAGLMYVTISNGPKLLACFRLRRDEQLKRLVRIPHELRGDE